MPSDLEIWFQPVCTSPAQAATPDCVSTDSVTTQFQSIKGSGSGLRSTEDTEAIFEAMKNLGWAGHAEQVLPVASCLMNHLNKTSEITESFNKQSTSAPADDKAVQKFWDRPNLSIPFLPVMSCFHFLLKKP